MGLIFTLLMTYGGAAVSLVRPYYGFLIYVCFSIIRPESLWHWSVPPGNYSRIIAVAFLLGWALSGFGNWSFGRARRPAFALLWFLIWAAVSAALCEYPQVALSFLENMAKIVLPTLAGLTLINTRKDIWQLAWTIVGSVGYVAYDLNRSYFDGFNRLAFDGFGGMDNNSMTIGLVTGVGFAFFLGLSETVAWRRYLSFAFAAFLTHAVFFSFSRGGMLGLCVVGLATAVVIPKTSRNLGLMTLGVVIALAMAGPEVVERFSSMTNTTLTGADEGEADWSAESRIDLWRICGQMTLESPVFGKGPDHFPRLVDRYRITGGVSDAYGSGKEAHTLWLQIMAELGLPGLFLLAAFYGLTLSELWRYVRLDKSDSQGLTPGATARMVWTALVGFIVSAQFVSLEGLELPYYVCLVGLSFLKLQAAEDLQEIHGDVCDGEVLRYATPWGREPAAWHGASPADSR
ncbi:O-antigen ligase family protein [Candidatus Laterigemmans baculatus]|uniref:O-antigen ligase family protein n=1 Tax=Candidatus Laterigemmans baculatus TaxID=2770505 RepID=UPI0013DAB199|nr:O-antigen ligase family protein [Candidatus Laterigemmans baculatus]